MQNWLIAEMDKVNQEVLNNGTVGIDDTSMAKNKILINEYNWRLEELKKKYKIQ